jgi:hypothetical protein
MSEPHIIEPQNIPLEEYLKKVPPRAACDPSILPYLRALRCQLDAAICALERGEAIASVDEHGRIEVELLKFEAGTVLVGDFAIRDRFQQKEEI